MKKLLKAIPALMLAIALCFTLGGCKQLDEEIARQAFWSDSDNANIIWNNSAYIRLKNNFKNHEISYDMFDDSIMVTKKDVPVLLTDMFSDATVFVSRDKKLLIDNEGSVIYCREDYLNDFNEIIKDIKYNNYCFNYYDPSGDFSFDEDAFSDVAYDQSYKDKEISQKDAKIIDSIVTAKNADNKQKETLFEQSVSSSSEVKIVAFSQGNLFSKTLFDVVKYKGNIYLCKDGNEEEPDEYAAVYKVPKKYNSVFNSVKDFLYEE